MLERTGWSSFIRTLIRKIDKHLKVFVHLLFSKMYYFFFQTKVGWFDTIH